MKIATSRVAAFLASPDPAIRAVLVYGPDGGMVDERIGLLARKIVPDPADPFRISRIAASELASDPARLADEAAAIAFGGGRRVVHVEDAGESAVPVLRSFLEMAAGDSLVLVQGDALGPRSNLRKLFEDADNAAALACYGDEGAALAAVIRDSLGAQGLAADPDALAWLSDHLGGDRRVTRSELDKLAIYMGKPGRLRIEDAVACVGDSTALSLDDLAVATADGDHDRAQHALDVTLREGSAPVAVLRALVRHFQRLHLLAGMVANGKALDAAIGSLQPKPYFRLADQLRAQAPRWPAVRAAAALDLLQTAEIDVKTTGMPAEAICGRAVMQLARAAAR